LLVIRNGRQEVHARTLTSVCKSGIIVDLPVHTGASMSGFDWLGRRKT